MNKEPSVHDSQFEKMLRLYKSGFTFEEEIQWIKDSTKARIKHFHTSGYPNKAQRYYERIETDKKVLQSLQIEYKYSSFPMYPPVNKYFAKELLCDLGLADTEIKEILSEIFNEEFKELPRLSGKHMTEQKEMIVNAQALIKKQHEFLTAGKERSNNNRLTWEVKEENEQLQKENNQLKQDIHTIEEQNKKLAEQLNKLLDWTEPIISHLRIENKS